MSRSFQAGPGKKNYTVCETAIGIRASPNHRCDFKENQTSILSLGTARATTMSNNAGCRLGIMIGHGLDECVSGPCLVCVLVTWSVSHLLTFPQTQTAVSSMRINGEAINQLSSSWSCHHLVPSPEETPKRSRSTQIKNIFTNKTLFKPQVSS